MTHPPQWSPPTAPGQNPEPRPPRKLLTVVTMIIRVIGTLLGVLFLIMAISALRTETIWLPWVSALAFAWALLYFSVVAPWLAHRTKTTSPPEPSGRVRSALKKATIGIAVPFLVMVVTGAVDIAVHPDEYEALEADTTTSSAQVSPSVSPTGEPTAAPTTADQPQPLAFTESMVRAHGVTKDNKGGQSNVRFVAGTDDFAQIEELQRQCVQHYLDITQAAYCYAYATDTDYAVTTIEWTPDFDESIYGGARPCWIIYGGQPIAGPPGTTTTKTALEYRNQQCPGGVRLPDDTPPEPTTNAPAPVPAHNACALLDPDALVAGGFSERTAPSPLAPDTAAHGDILATYACGNADTSIVIEVDLHTSDQSARESADYNTSSDQTFLINSGTRVPFDTSRGGAKIINTELGVSRVSWSHGPYAVLLEIMSDPVVSGLPATHPYDRIDTMITTIVERADARLATGNW